MLWAGSSRGEEWLFSDDWPGMLSSWLQSRLPSVHPGLTLRHKAGRGLLPFFSLAFYPAAPRFLLGVLMHSAPSSSSDCLLDTDTCCASSQFELVSIPTSHQVLRKRWNPYLRSGSRQLAHRCYQASSKLPQHSTSSAKSSNLQSWQFCHSARSSRPFKPRYRSSRLS